MTASATAKLESFIDDLPAERQRRIEGVVRAIEMADPKAKFSIRSGRPFFHSGKRWIAVASKLRHILIYAREAESIQAYLERYPKTRHGIRSLRFADRDPIDLDAMMEVARRALSKHPGSPDSPAGQP